VKKTTILLRLQENRMSDPLPPELRHAIDTFCEGLSRKGQTDASSVSVPRMAVSLIKRIIQESQGSWTSTASLMSVLKSEGRQMMADSGTSGNLIGNLFRRILKLVREEYASSFPTVEDEATVADSTSSPSGGGEKAMMSDATNDYSRAPDSELLDKIYASIDELSMELLTSADEISDQALEHIHANEVILTFGRSKTVESFLKRAAAKGRTFQVIVAEAAPFYGGHELAASLAKAKIATTVITDSAIFAVMSRVNKVIVGTHTIMADGGLKAHTGTHTVALAAHHYSVPFIVAASIHKLTPQYFTRANKEAFGAFVSPQDILRGGLGGGVANSKMASKMHAELPLFEYVPPDLVTLFISNMSGHAPSYVYRLLNELYHQDDYQL